MEANKNFETYIEDSKKILEKLMNPELPLDEGVRLYKEGMQTLQEAQKMLENAKLEYETIKLSQGSLE